LAAGVHFHTGHDEAHLRISPSGRARTDCDGGRAHAHPHVFAEARLEVAVAPDGHVEALRHVWRFDELFSSTVLLEFDADTDNRLEEPELEEVASVVTESIAEFGYFQTITSAVRMSASSRSTT
jgi:ABC-type uncharacterized transport system substrate-binding protein